MVGGRVAAGAWRVVVAIATMFAEKRGDGAGVVASMTRVVAFLFAWEYLQAFGHLARTGVAIGWPMATLGVVVLLAVPLQALFTGTRAHELAAALIRRLGVGGVGRNAAAAAVEAVARHRYDPGA